MDGKLGISKKTRSGGAWLKFLCLSLSWCFATLIGVPVTALAYDGQTQTSVAYDDRSYSTDN